MTMTRSDWLAAATVILTAVGLSSAAGYQIGNGLFSERVENIENKLSRQIKLNKMNAEGFLSKISELSISIDEKERLISEISTHEAQIEENLELISRMQASLEEKFTIINNISNDIHQLEAFISKDFDRLDEITVASNKSAWIIPGKIAVSVGIIFGDDAYVTITDTIDNKLVGLAQRTPLHTTGENCSIIPTAISQGTVTFSISCIAVAEE